MSQGHRGYIEYCNSVLGTESPQIYLEPLSQNNAEEGVLCAELGAGRLDLPHPGYFLGSDNLLLVSSLSVLLSSLFPLLLIPAKQDYYCLKEGIFQGFSF